MYEPMTDYHSVFAQECSTILANISKKKVENVIVLRKWQVDVLKVKFTSSPRVSLSLGSDLT